jgi:hypothetical protein
LGNILEALINDIPNCAFNHLKAQPNSNGKSMSDVLFSFIHLCVLPLRIQPFKSTTKFQWEYNVRYVVYLYNNLMCHHCASSITTQLNDLDRS